MSAPYSPYTDMRVTMCVGILIQSFLFKLDELDICKPPCSILWREILAVEARGGSERDDIEFESSRDWMTKQSIGGLQR